MIFPSSSPQHILLLLQHLWPKMLEEFLGYIAPLGGIKQSVSSHERARPMERGEANQGLNV